MIYVYAVADDPNVRFGETRGLDDATVEAVADGPLAAICTFHDTFEPRPDVDELQRHHGVVESVMDQCTVVPARFGTVFPGLEPLADALRSRQHHLVRVLAELRGKVELAVRVRVKSPTSDWPLILDNLHATLGRQASSAVLCSHGPNGMTAAYLVGAADVASFQQATASLLGASNDMIASLTGPWPPYSFSAPAALDSLTDRAGAGWAHG